MDMPKLVKAAGSWHKMASNWVFIAIAVLTAVKTQWGDVFSAVLPDSWYAPIVAILAVLGVVARLIDQGLENHA